MCFPNDWWCWACFHVLTYHLYVAQMVKKLPAVQEIQVWSLGWEDPLEKGIATHSNILAWRTPRTEEPGGWQSMGLQRVGHNWATNTHMFFSEVSLQIFGPFLKIGFSYYWALSFVFLIQILHIHDLQTFSPESVACLHSRRSSSFWWSPITTLPCYGLCFTCHIWKIFV